MTLTAKSHRHSLRVRLILGLGSAAFFVGMSSTVLLFFTSESNQKNIWIATALIFALACVLIVRTQVDSFFKAFKIVLGDIVTQINLSGK